jgi:hypothetical protein
MNRIPLLYRIVHSFVFHYSKLWESLLSIKQNRTILRYFSGACQISSYVLSIGSCVEQWEELAGVTFNRPRGTHLLPPLMLHVNLYLKLQDLLYKRIVQN